MRHSIYSAVDAPKWSEMSVLQAAHAAEILVKARIAQEHPLLIFEQLPRPGQAVGSTLELKDLLEKGRTLQFQELPARLWATTGIRLPDEARYERFGRLRNTIQHFATPQDVDLNQETLEFVFKVIDPFINHCWGLFAIDYNEDMDHYEHILGPLAARNIKFLVSPDAAKFWMEGGYSYESDLKIAKPSYKREMVRRIKAVHKTMKP